MFICISLAYPTLSVPQRALISLGSDPLLFVFSIREISINVKFHMQAKTKLRDTASYHTGKAYEVPCAFEIGMKSYNGR